MANSAPDAVSSSALSPSFAPSPILGPSPIPTSSNNSVPLPASNYPVTWTTAL